MTKPEIFEFMKPFLFLFILSWKDSPKHSDVLITLPAEDEDSEFNNAFKRGETALQQQTIIYKSQIRF